MKYSRLTKEQFEELHQEFINFLATQSITADEWKNIKAEEPEVPNRNSMFLVTLFGKEF